MQKEIYITEVDRERLKRILSEALNSGKASEQAITKLEHEISKAVVVNPHQIPKDIITMNSRAVLHLDDEDMEVSLVYPEDADRISNKLSILSPIGTAILGYAEGDIVQWQVPSGVTEIQIKEVLYQPEAAGDPL
ncbi:MAG: nucleoside diphosphate kinase regulator [Clostridiaceae bacterium]|nr:nucleoside diphosphate kinase regulator [Clostridiaceae bacterium]